MALPSGIQVRFWVWHVNCFADRREKNVREWRRIDARFNRFVAIWPHASITQSPGSRWLSLASGNFWTRNCTQCKSTCTVTFAFGKGYSLMFVLSKLQSVRYALKPIWAKEPSPLMKTTSYWSAGRLMHNLVASITTMSLQNRGLSLAIAQRSHPCTKESSWGISTLHFSEMFASLPLIVSSALIVSCSRFLSNLASNAW